MSNQSQSTYKSYGCDLFGQSSFFNFRGSGSATSMCGLVVTVLFILFSIWSIYEMGKDMFFKEQPDTVFITQFVEDPETVVVSPESFNMAFGIEHPITYIHYRDESIYTATAYYVTKRTILNDDGDPEFQFTFDDLALTTCTEEHFGDMAEKTATLPLTQLYCFDEEQPNLDELVIHGRFESEFYQYIQVQFKPCNNDTSEIPCAPQEDIEFYLKGAYYAVYYKDMNIDLKDFDQPDKKHIGTHFSIFGMDYFKSYTFYVKTVDLISDIGWLMSDETTRNFAAFHSNREDVDFRDQDVFMDFHVRVSPHKEIYSRSYIKLQDVFSEVDGLATIALLLMAFVVFPYIKVKYYSELINEVFDTRIYRSPKGKSIFDERKKKRNSRSSLKFKPQKQDSCQKDYEIKIQDNKEERDLINQSSMQRKLQPWEEKIQINEIDEDGFDSFDQKGQKKSIHHQQQRHSKSKIEDADIVLDTEGPRAQNFSSLPMKKMLHVKKPHQKDGGQTEVVEPSLSEIPESEEDRRSHTARNGNIQMTPTPEKPNQFETGNKISSQGNLDFKTTNPQSSDAKTQVAPFNRKGAKYESSPSKNYESSDKNYGRKASDVYEIQETESLEDIIRKTFEEKPERIEVGFFEWARSFFSFDPAIRKKMELIKEGEKKIVEKLDIFKIIRTMREVDKLKAILLNADQLMLFENLPKLVLEKQSREVLKQRFDEGNAHFYTGSMVVQSKVQRISTALTRIEHKENPTEIDQRLLEIFGQNLE